MSKKRIVFDYLDNEEIMRTLEYTGMSAYDARYGLVMYVLYAVFVDNPVWIESSQTDPKHLVRAADIFVSCVEEVSACADSRSVRETAHADAINIDFPALVDCIDRLLEFFQLSFRQSLGLTENCQLDFAHHIPPSLVMFYAHQHPQAKAPQKR